MNQRGLYKPTSVIIFVPKAAFAIVAVISVILCWELTRSLSQTTLLPRTGRILEACSSYLNSPDCLVDVKSSVFRFAFGYVTGCAIGIACGVVTASEPVADRTFGVLLRLIRPLPPLALAPFIGIMFGYSEASRFIIVAISAFHPVWIGTYQGVQATPDEYLWVSRFANGRRRWDELWIHVMSSLPHVLAGMRVAIGAGFTALVAAEASGTSSGILYRVYVDTITFRLDRAIASLIVLCVVCYLCDWCFRAANKLCFPWIFEATHESRR